MAEEVSSARDTLRARSARNRRRQQGGPVGTGGSNALLDPNQAEFAQPAESPLMVRLKDNFSVPEERPKSRLGQLNPFAGRGEQGASLLSTKSDIKETLKRPLSSFFKRPSSRAGNANNFTATEEVHELTKDEDAIEWGSRPRSDSGDQVPLNLDSVAHAPVFPVNMYKFDLPSLNNPELTRLEEIDLSLLVRYLQVDEEVSEEKVPWTWDYLYANILSETREEWDFDDNLPDNS